MTKLRSRSRYVRINRTLLGTNSNSIEFSWDSVINCGAARICSVEILSGTALHHWCLDTKIQEQGVPSNFFLSFPSHCTP